VVPDDKLAVALDSLLEELQTLSPSVLQLTRKTLGRIHFADFAKQLEEVERVYLTELMQTHDAQEGVRAFLRKRSPIWKGK
jgi:cyclohexa-1,5-dienecarbonyl-CoA hydratase